MAAIAVLLANAILSIFVSHRGTGTRRFRPTTNGSQCACCTSPSDISGLAHEYENNAALWARSLSENPIWLRAACYATGRRPAPSTIYSDIACFAVLASHKTARSRADDGMLRQTPSVYESQENENDCSDNGNLSND